MNNIIKRITPFVKLGQLLQSKAIDEITVKAYQQNHWFTPEFVKQALTSVAEEYLNETTLTQWLSAYPVSSLSPRKVGVVMAGNVPAVGFHDLLCVLLSGHHLMAKLSTDDRTLMLSLIEKLIEIEPLLASRITIAERLNAADAYIATGSDNTARYFEYYFSGKPHLIRRNRTSAGVLTGNETTEELTALGDDVLQYFGLGCRNVAKVYVPTGYDFRAFYEAIEPRHDYFRNHHKYFNNYEYNKSVYLINGEPHFDNGFLITRESEALVSPISVLFFEYYSSYSALSDVINKQRDKIQCVVSSAGSYPQSVPFGQAQSPGLFDYADGIDTMAFLSHL